MYETGLYFRNIVCMPLDLSLRNRWNLRKEEENVDDVPPGVCSSTSDTEIIPIDYGKKKILRNGTAAHRLVQSSVRRILCFLSLCPSSSTDCEPDHLVANSSSIQNVLLMWMSTMHTAYDYDVEPYCCTQPHPPPTHLHTINSLWPHSFVDPFQRRIPKTKTTALTSAHLTGNTTPQSPFQLLCKIATFCVCVCVPLRASGSMVVGLALFFHYYCYFTVCVHRACGVLFVNGAIEFVDVSS